MKFSKRNKREMKSFKVFQKATKAGDWTGLSMQDRFVIWLDEVGCEQLVFIVK